jgi:hypothetical protein
VSPEPASYDPEEFVDGSQPWPRLLALKDGELLAKGEVFEHQTAMRPKPAKHGSEPEPKQVKHGNKIIADRLCRLPCEVVNFTAGQDCDEGQYDYLPEAMTRRVKNLSSFAGILAFDKWTCNADGRQAAFWKRRGERKFTASFIDQGYCFNAGEWSFPDAPLRGVFARNDVYAGITGWDSFEPWLSRIESFPETSLWPLVSQIPPEWYLSAVDELDRLACRLLERRSLVRDLVRSFKNSSRNPFPNWLNGAS